jgi:hypothetical protein
MEGKEIGPEAARNMWIYAINSRLNLNICLTSSSFGKDGITRKQLNQTCSGTLSDDRTPAELWPGCGVLVGIRPERGVGEKKKGSWVSKWSSESHTVCVNAFPRGSGYFLVTVYYGRYIRARTLNNKRC